MHRGGRHNPKRAIQSTCLTYHYLNYCVVLSSINDLLNLFMNIRGLKVSYFRSVQLILWWKGSNEHEISKRLLPKKQGCTSHQPVLLIGIVWYRRPMTVQCFMWRASLIQPPQPSVGESFRCSDWGFLWTNRPASSSLPSCGLKG